LSTFKKVSFPALPLGNLAHAQMWVSADEYKEDPDIIHKKAF
jgi:hypothetical protein